MYMSMFIHVYWHWWLHDCGITILLMHWTYRSLGVLSSIEFSAKTKLKLDILNIMKYLEGATVLLLCYAPLTLRADILGTRNLDVP